MTFFRMDTKLLSACDNRSHLISSAQRRKLKPGQPKSSEIRFAQIHSDHTYDGGYVIRQSRDVLAMWRLHEEQESRRQRCDDAETSESSIAGHTPKMEQHRTGNAYTQQLLIALGHLDKKRSRVIATLRYVPYWSTVKNGAMKRT